MTEYEIDAFEKHLPGVAVRLCSGEVVTTPGRSFKLTVTDNDGSVIFNLDNCKLVPPTQFIIPDELTPVQFLESNGDECMTNVTGQVCDAARFSSATPLGGR